MDAFLVSDVACRQCGDASDACSYRVAWSINPHMVVGAVEVERARWQHASFVHLLEMLGADVTRLPFVHGAHDSVFAKDNAIVVDDGALLAHPRHAERVQEQEARARALEAAGIAVVARATRPLEGGDVVVLPGVQGAFLGHGFRSDPRAASELERFLDAPVTPLELVDPRLYHLDMVLSILSDGTAIVCEEALSRESRARVRSAARDVVAISTDDALSFGINMVEIGRDVVLGGTCPAIARALEARSYRVHHPALDQFQLGGGSAACLVSRRHASTTRRSQHAA